MHLSGIDAVFLSGFAVFICTSFCMLNQCIANTCIMAVQEHACTPQLQHLLLASTVSIDTAEARHNAGQTRCCALCVGGSPPAMQDEEEQTQDHVPRQASNPAAKPSRMATLRQVSILSRCIVCWQSCALTHSISSWGRMYHALPLYAKALRSAPLSTMSSQSAH